MSALEKRKYSAKTIVALCTIAYFASYFSRKTFAVVMVDMIKISIVEKSVAGVVGTALFVFYGAGQLISGYLGDRLKPEYLMFSGLMVSAVCNFLLPLVPNQYLMVPIWAVNGFAQALLWPPIVRILSDNLSHEKYVTANLIVTCGAHVSTIVLYIYAPICISYMSYKAVFFTSTIFCVVVGVLFLFAMMAVLKGEGQGENTSVKSEQAHKSETIWNIFKSSGVLTVFLCIIVMGFMRDGIESWLPTLYSEAFGRDSTESILVSVSLPVFSIISLFAVRIIHKKRMFNNEAMGAGILFAISVVLCIPFAIMINMEYTATRIVCLILAGVVCACMHSCNFLLISCLPGRFASTGRASTVGGFCNACTYIGAATSMYGIALISDWLGWRATVISWIGVLLIGVLFAILSLKKYSKFLQK